MKNSGFIVVRFLFGLGLIVLGLDGFFNLFPFSPAQGETQQLVEVLEKTGFFFPVVNGVEILCGILMMTNRFVPLVVLSLAPVAVTAFLFHVMGGLSTLTVLTGTLAALELFLLFSYRHYYQELFVARGVPDLSHNYITAEFM